MKKMVPFIFMAMMTGFFPQTALSPLYASDEGYNALITHVAEQSFIPGPISRTRITQILHAGGRAPSANNRQPWHFTVVQNAELGKQLIPAFQDGNVLIVVSVFGDGKTNVREILDGALAVENMYLAAQALGLGSRIYTGPIDTLNSKFKEALALPNGYSAAALVRIGQVNLGPDAVSSVSPRKNLNSIVTYK